MKKLALQLALAMLCGLLISVHGVAAAGKGNPGIANIKKKIKTKKTYADLGAEWWQWALQAPGLDNPLGDETGEKCRVGQEGPVWFLAGTSGSGDLEADPTVRDCEVPGGKTIFFPVINAAYFAFINDEPPETRTADFVRTTAQMTCDSTTIEDLWVSIDGVPVKDPAQYYTSADQSPIFQVQLPTDNFFGVTDDIAPELLLSPAAHQGFYIYLKKPLAAGEHTIEWTATWDCPGLGDTRSENVMYYLNVLEGVSGEVQ